MPRDRVWLARVTHHARALRADPSPDVVAWLLALPEPPALAAAHAALGDPAASSPVRDLLAAYEALEADRVAAAAELERAPHLPLARLRAVLARGADADLRALWDAVDARMGRGPQRMPRDRAALVERLARRPLDGGEKDCAMRIDSGGKRAQ